MKTTILAGVSILALSLAALSGCKKEDAIIQKVTFKASENLEVVRVSLVFNSKKIQSDIGGGFTLKDYGYLFVNPFLTETQPFEVGFDLNTSIVNDQDYVKLAPTTVLPNGVPLGLDYALVQVQVPLPADSKVGAYAYLDVLRANWLGTAMMLNFLDPKSFPPGLAVSQVFYRDPAGKPGVIGYVFGASLNPDGSVKTHGGVALLANVRQLIAQLGHGGKRTLELRPEPAVYLSGPDSARFLRNPLKLLKLERDVVRGMK